MEKEHSSSLNVVERCRELHVPLWQCPHFLFIMMGVIISLSIITTHLVATSYADVEPETVVSIISALTIFLFVLGNAIVKAFEKVTEASHLKSEFIAIISHELRNPLASIKWRIDTLFEKDQVPADEYTSSLRIINNSNEKMIGLINDLLDINRIEDRRFSLSPAIFSLNELTEEIIKSFEPIAAASNLKFLVLTPKTPNWVKADKTRIKSVITRFVDNAVRYSTLPGEITLTLEDLGGYVRWSITDQGAGIPMDEARNIFSNFFRASNILRYQTEGLGVGLYLSKYIIEASGGTVGFRTLEGHGSTFYFSLPKTTV
ncbi:HAMP domain-containing histidine kinase [Candidatus Giovannonibacteria bacterium]|nr:HAMP domain-containing histidine kinase [Candidatus Giovannonibacteria bacterium]